MVKGDGDEYGEVAMGTSHIEDNISWGWSESHQSARTPHLSSNRDKQSHDH